MRHNSRRCNAAAGLAAVTLAAIIGCLVLLQPAAAEPKQCEVTFPNLCGCDDEACSRCEGCPEELKVRVKKVQGKLVVVDDEPEVGARRHLLTGSGSDAASLLAGGAVDSGAQQLKAAASRTLAQFDGSKLICDGRINTLRIPEAPYGNPPNSFNAYLPYNSPAGLTCNRNSGQCGNLASVSCLPFSSNIGPVSFGASNLILPPSSPLKFTVTGNKYLTFLNWTVFDVGTGGAQMKAYYGNGGFERTTYTWAAPPAATGDACGTCTGCVLDSGSSNSLDGGIKVMSLAADQGAGFRSFELGQLYETSACGKSCFDLDASYWLGMTYSCAEPTCGDTNLDVPGDQRYDCSQFGQGWLFNDANADSTSISRDTCCIRRPSCGNVNPGSVPAQQFSCNSDSQYVPQNAELSPPSQSLCCEDKLCGDTLPVTAPNTPFPCSSFPPAGSWVYNPLFAGLKPPSLTLCCKQQASCGNSQPGSSFPIPFSCDPSISEYNPASASIIPATQSNCCLPKTCGNISPVTSPNRQWTCTLPSSTFNTSAFFVSPPSDANCCIQSTCGDSKPETSIPVPFDCTPKEQYQYDPTRANLPASQANCCLLRTCNNNIPAFVPPLTPYTCPAGKLFVPSNNPASEANCCIAQTCANAVNGGPYDCSEGNNVLPDGTKTTCIRLPNFGTIPAPTGVNLLTTCCECTTRPASGIDVAIAKTGSTVGPVVAGSQTRITFTITVVATALDSTTMTSISNVKVTDYVPSGFYIVSANDLPVSFPSNCQIDRTKNLVTCTIPTLTLRVPKNIEVVVLPILAGKYINCAQESWDPPVGLLDSDPNSEACAPALQIQGSCCLKDLVNNQVVARCTQTMPDTCNLIRSRTRNQTFTANLPCQSVDCLAVTVNEGACCVPKDISTCVERVAESGCLKAGGKWFSQKLCSDVPCKDPTGACCNAMTGDCRDGLTLLQCPLSQSLWKKAGSCSDPRFCVGACCRNPGTSFALCQENTKAFNCQGPNQFWHLYGQCHQQTCPSDEKCVPCWNKCDPRNDQCCPTCSCQYTYKGCPAGEWVCKPQKTCVDEGGPCGGDSGGCCCDGLECQWDYRYRRGICAPKRPKCIDNGGYCRSDGECCPGNRCYGGRSRTITYRMCYRPCFGYSCYVDRRRDFDCFYANVAGRWKY